MYMYLTLDSTASKIHDILTYSSSLSSHQILTHLIRIIKYRSKLKSSSFDGPVVCDYAVLHPVIGRGNCTLAKTRIPLAVIFFFATTIII
jgi:hypothetical protein